jgi:hypothetical protein
MTNTKNVYLELQDFLKKEKLNKEQFHVLKTDAERIYESLRKGEDISHLSEEFVGKHNLKQAGRSIGDGGIIVVVIIIIIIIHLPHPGDPY